MELKLIPVNPTTELCLDSFTSFINSVCSLLDFENTFEHCPDTDCFQFFAPYVNVDLEVLIGALGKINTYNYLNSKNLYRHTLFKIKDDKFMVSFRNLHEGKFQCVSIFKVDYMITDTLTCDSNPTLIRNGFTRKVECGDLSESSKIEEPYRFFSLDGEGDDAIIDRFTVTGKENPEVSDIIYALDFIQRYVD